MMIPCVPDKQMTSPCDLYATPTTVWPKQQFPANHPAVSRIGQRERIAIKDAWNFFERVESIDAATRVRLGNTSGLIRRPPPNLWYPFAGDGERMLYEKGRRYHMIICPALDWTPQRNLPIPSTPLTTVLPNECPCYDPCGCDVEPLLRSVAQPGTRSQPIQEQPSTQLQKTTTRSATLVKEGIPTKVTEDHTKITIVENTPSTPRSAATPTSTASPHLSGTSTPKSEKENPPALVITDVSPRSNTPTELPADRIQLV